jgi:formate hydrogenlyase subunit 3/multisubunit Na+/H+ antiporter MnhD subunit
MTLLVVAVAILLVCAALTLLPHRQPVLCTTLGAIGAVVACGLAMVPALQVLLGAPSLSLQLPWRAPTEDILLGLDPLSAFFLVPLLALGALTAIYGRTYMLAYRAQRSLGPATASFSLLLAAMITVVVARSTVLFLVAWEAMTLSSYLLVTFEHGQAEVRRAGWVYLVAAHVGEACLIAMFLLLDHRASGLGFAGFAAMPVPGAGLATIIFILAVVGFGIKAGFLPFHVWLPEAHAAAPSHVSALMSGVMIKVGLYGLLRITTFLPTASFWGPALLALGVAGALWGISLALYQRDMKRVLAYSSVENMGIITIGIGLAFWRASRGDFLLATLGACGALLHVWNHVVMKGLMFLAAGSVLHGSGTKDIEKLGGLMKRMPRTGAAMLVGAVAIAGLPPLNGFVSEWLIYLGLMGGSLPQTGGASIAALLGTGLLALIGGLAALCFVRLIGIVLLGEGRSPAARSAHESATGMTSILAVLVVLAAAMAIVPRVLVGLLAPVVKQVFGAEIADRVHLVQSSVGVLGTVNGAVWVAVGLAALLWLVFRRAPATAVPRPPTWDCGYAAATARMEYTGRSFSEFLSYRLLPRMLRPRATTKAPEGPFPGTSSFASRCSDPLTHGVYEPFFLRWADRFTRLRWIQQGALHIYLLYIFVVAVVALAWLSWSTWMAS